MLISRELDYALRILRGLGDGDMHTMRALCEDELIPQKFAYKIIRKLAAADFITAVRGVGGGVRLTADLSALTLYDLLKVFQPDERVNHCTSGGYCCEWMEATQKPCQTRAYLTDLEARLARELKRDSLATMLFEKQ